MKCGGLHCPGCSNSASLIPAAALAVGVWFAVTHEHTLARVIDALLITAGITVGIVLVLTVAGLVRVSRRESLTQISWNRPAVQAGADRRQAIRAPAAPILTAEQVAGLAALGQAVMDVQAHGTGEATSRAYVPATIINDAQEIPR